MANPRKFSEKIALHTHRQAEETARFEQIMKEVSDATARVAPDRGSSKNTLRINNQSLGMFRGGSLPNVSAGAPTVKPATRISDNAKPDELPHTPSPHSHSHSNMVGYRESRPRSQGGPIRRPHDRKLDTSPYGPFLSPPPDTSWRRTNSDSALHQSAMQGLNTDRNDNSNSSNTSRWMLQTMNGSEQQDGRPRSSCEVPRVPGINIYPSAHEPGTIQIPIGNNTGSLPDLTNVHFPSPIHTPLDQDQDQGSSPYSSSPVNTTPSTLSPTSLPPGVRQHGRHFQFTHVPQQQTNHLSVPVNNSYLHHNKGVTLDKTLARLVDEQDFTQLGGMNFYQHHQSEHQQQHHQQQQQQQQIPPTSPSPTLQQAAGYRSPRPSPQSSPSLGGRHSAPCSPSAPSPLPNDYNLFNQHQAAQFQQHFEQLSMDWAQLVASLVESGCTWSAQVQGVNNKPNRNNTPSGGIIIVLDPPVSNVSYLDQTNNVQLSPTNHQNMPEVSGVGNIDLTSDAGYYSTSPSQLVYQTAPTSLHTTPNTPTSIPDIILTDFSSAAELRAGLLSDESLREGLGTLDFNELQMLSDPGINLISDGVEDHFRLDRS